jgi:hypothetical protein
LTIKVFLLLKNDDLLDLNESSNSKECFVGALAELRAKLSFDLFVNLNWLLVLDASVSSSMMSLRQQGKHFPSTLENSFLKRTLHAP